MIRPPTSSDGITLDPARPLSKDAAAAVAQLLAIYEIGRQLLEQREPREVLQTIQRAIVTICGPTTRACCP
jgi:hypothetical protein